MTLSGWVARRRDHGGLIFVDLRDRTGVVQVVIDPADAPEAHAVAHDLRVEAVVRVVGEVVARSLETVNPRLDTGEVEVAARELAVLGPADPLPFQLEDENVDETLRLRHRALDLRRPVMTERQRVRAQVARIMRRHLEDRGFWEIETPILGKSTPEGARDFLVPARLRHGSFYALPQSPQLYKQLTQLAGFERYYQIARCFRDEAQRADRQLEFTQLDVEMSFVTQDDVMELMEGLYAELWRELLGVELELPLRRLTHAEAMLRYGSDRPDLRFGLEIADVTELVRGSEFSVFRGAAESRAASCARWRVPAARAWRGASSTSWRPSPRSGAARGSRTCCSRSPARCARRSPSSCPRPSSTACARRRARARATRSSSPPTSGRWWSACSARCGRTWRSASSSSPTARGRSRGSSTSRPTTSTRTSAAGWRSTTSSRRRGPSTRRCWSPIPARCCRRPTTSSSTATRPAAARSASTAPTCRSGRWRWSASPPTRPRRASASSCARCASVRRRTVASRWGSTAASCSWPAPTTFAT